MLFLSLFSGHAHLKDIKPRAQTATQTLLPQTYVEIPDFWKLSVFKARLFSPLSLLKRVLNPFVSDNASARRNVFFGDCYDLQFYQTSMHSQGRSHSSFFFLLIMWVSRTYITPFRSCLMALPNPNSLFLRIHGYSVCPPFFFPPDFFLASEPLLAKGLGLWLNDKTRWVATKKEMCSHIPRKFFPPCSGFFYLSSQPPPHLAIQLDPSLCL